jgi:hypothetical protein
MKYREQKAHNALNLLKAKFLIYKHFQRKFILKYFMGFVNIACEKFH